MSGIFNAIKDFFATIGSIFEFVFKAVKMLISLLVNGITFLVTLVSSLPVPFIGGAIALIVVCVLYKVLGRENQS